MFVILGGTWSAFVFLFWYLHAIGAALSGASSILPFVVIEIVWLSGQALLIWGTYRLTLFVSDGRRSAFWAVVEFGAAATLAIPVLTVIVWLTD